MKFRRGRAAVMDVCLSGRDSTTALSDVPEPAVDKSVALHNAAGFEAAAGSADAELRAVAGAAAADPGGWGAEEPNVGYYPGGSEP